MSAEWLRGSFMSATLPSRPPNTTMPQPAPGGHALRPGLRGRFKGVLENGVAQLIVRARIGGTILVLLQIKALGRTGRECQGLGHRGLLYLPMLRTHPHPHRLTEDVHGVAPGERGR